MFTPTFSFAPIPAGYHRVSSLYFFATLYQERNPPCRRISLVRTSMVRNYVIVRRLVRSLIKRTINHCQAKILTLLNKKKVCCQQFLLIVKWQEVYRYDKEKNIERKGDIARYEQCLLFSQ